MKGFGTRRGTHLAALLFASILATSSRSAIAVTLEVSGGVLIGASGVDVGGTFYDVAFQDGRCVDLFDGCDEPSDFLFHDFATATLAAQALLDQVFLDGLDGAFDSDPSLTSGCASPTQCSAWTNWMFFGSAYLYSSRNSNDLADSSAIAAFENDPLTTIRDLGADAHLTYAIWTETALPEPGAGWLYLVGALGLSAANQRRASQ